MMRLDVLVIGGPMLWQNLLQLTGSSDVESDENWEMIVANPKFEKEVDG